MFSLGVLKTSQTGSSSRRMFSPRSFEKSGLLPGDMNQTYGGSTESQNGESNSAKGSY